MYPRGVERRRGPRVKLSAPVLVRRIDTQREEQFKEETASNVSLAGVYFETSEIDAYKPNAMLITSVAIPETYQSREFPFTRLAGQSRVVRIVELSEHDQENQKRFGVALEFGSDLTALTAVPGRG